MQGHQHRALGPQWPPTAAEQTPELSLHGGLTTGPQHPGHRHNRITKLGAVHSPVLIALTLLQGRPAAGVNCFLLHGLAPCCPGVAATPAHPPQHPAESSSPLACLGLQNWPPPASQGNLRCVWAELS